MTVADFATTGDVAALRALSVAETSKAALFVSWASALIRSKVDGIDARITSGALDPVLPKMIVVAATLDALDKLTVSPGAKSQSVTTGPYTKSVTYAEAVRSGLISISDADLAVLQATTPSGPASSGVGTIRLAPGFGYLSQPPRWPY